MCVINRPQSDVVQLYYVDGEFNDVRQEHTYLDCIVNHSLNANQNTNHDYWIASQVSETHESFLL